MRRWKDVEVSWDYSLLPDDIRAVTERIEPHSWFYFQLANIRHPEKEYFKWYNKALLDNEIITSEEAKRLYEYWTTEVSDEVLADIQNNGYTKVKDNSEPK